MAVDKLVDSAQLDSDLEDVADAIRAKSGGSDSLAFPSGFISEIGSIQTGGGALNVEYGSVVVPTAGSQITISHGLDSQKVFCLISPKNGNTYTASAGYQKYSFALCNIKAIFGAEYSVNCSGYNPSVGTETVSTSGNNIVIGAGNMTPWSNQTAFYPATNQYSTALNSGATFTNNSIVTDMYGGFCAGEYNYVVVAV